MICFGRGNSKTQVIEFYDLFHLRSSGNPPPTGKVSIRGVPKKFGRSRWKVAMAGVPITIIAFIVKVYGYAKRLHRFNAKDLAVQAERSEWQGAMSNLGMTFSELARAVESVHKQDFGISEIDITEDIPGTLDPAELKRQMAIRDMKPRENSRCGKNCVKWDTEEYTVMVYNKVAETVQQGKAKKDTEADKFCKLLLP
eukprot:CAMPEP_0184298834 /NCGR_PEP_ID=MMETSP1049-20130417/9561_1 /TAXON_ID=77928 /ORGANISM="Proteomonas sulcata, Strain CCMP704" /LENGTH=197 /DNA_ID=CAMNT_0026609081 /DNA_START=118 /DNA_END=708 /DNA_ORIENTATION=-